MAVCSVITLVLIRFVKNSIYDFLQQVNIKTSEMCKNTIHLESICTPYGSPSFFFPIILLFSSSMLLD